MPYTKVKTALMPMMNAMTTSSPSSDTLHARLQKGIAWNLVGAVFNQGSTFAVNIIIAHLLSRQVFGEYAMIQSTLLTMATIAQLATGYTATKYVAEFRSTDQDKTGRILGLCSVVSAAAACVATLILLVGAPWLAVNAFNAPHLAPALMIAAGVVLFMVMNGYQMGALAGLESYLLLAKAGVISGSLYLGICVVAAWIGGLHGVLVGLVVSALLQWTILSYFLFAESARQKIVIRYRGLWQEREIILKFALPAALSGFISLPALWLANTFLVRQPDGYEQMALYSAANSFRVLVLILPHLMNNVGTSLLNNQKGMGDESRYRKVFWVNLTLTAGSVSIGALTVVLFGPWLLGMFGRGFGEGYAVLLVLMLSTTPEALAVATYQVVQSQGKMWLSLFVVSLPRDGMIVLMSYLFSPLYGAVGLAGAYTLGWILALLTIIAMIAHLGLGISGSKRQRFGLAHTVPAARQKS
jgi:O-antigen/teichoic acid export membrane protein